MNARIVRRAAQAAALTFLTVAAAAGPAWAQRNAPTITISQGAKELSEPFSVIRSLVELRDGRLLVFDSKEKELLLVDFARDVQTQAAQQGAGPLEFNAAGLMLRGPADSAVYYDMMQRRFLIFSPKGAPTRSVPYGGTDPLAMLALPQPIVIDAAGRVYGQAMGVRVPTGGLPGAGGPIFADTTVVSRYDFRAGRTDTVAKLLSVMAQSQPRMEMTGGAMKMTMTAPDYRANDVWTALPDGRVAILRAGEYRVRFVAPGARETVGPPVPHVLIPLTPAMQRATMDSIRAALAATLGATNRAMAEAGAPPTAMSRFEFDVKEPAKWATHLPPYTTIQASPDGLLWVSVPIGVGDLSGHHDVLDGSGALIARVQFAPGEALIGLGHGVAYTIRKDADDLQYLRRYTLPAPMARR
jgi:hypothetical protein